MLARRFKGPEGLWYFDRKKPTVDVQRRNPESIFCERAHNRIWSFTGGGHDQIEHHFSKIESRLSPLIDRVVASVRARGSPRLSQDDRFALSAFVFQLRKRPPEARERLAAMADLPGSFDQYLAHFEEHAGKKATAEEIRLLRTSASMDRVLHNSSVMASTKVDGSAIPSLAACGICFGYPTAGRSFVIGSNPVVRTGGELGSPDSAAYLPLASDVLLLFLEKSHEGAGYELPTGEVRKVNHASWGQSNSIAGCSLDLVRRIAGRAIKLKRRRDSRK